MSALAKHLGGRSPVFSSSLWLGHQLRPILDGHIVLTPVREVASMSELTTEELSEFTKALCEVQALLQAFTCCSFTLTSVTNI